MEGISHEAASFAEHLGLGRLVVLWDNNAITIDGSVDRSRSDDQLARFAAYGWHPEAVLDGTDIEAIDQAIIRAKADPRPCAPGVEGTANARTGDARSTALTKSHPGSCRLSIKRRETCWGTGLFPITPYPPKCQCDESTWGSGRIYRESCQQY